MVKKSKATSKKKTAQPGKARGKTVAKLAREAPHKTGNKTTTEKAVTKRISTRGPALKSQQPPKKTSSVTDAAKSAEPAPGKPNPDTTAAEEAHRITADQLRKQIMAKARGGGKSQRAAAFTLDDVRGELAKATPRPEAPKTIAPAEPEPSANKKAASTSKSVVEAPNEKRTFEPASLADILGYNPSADERPADEESQIDRKYLKYYRLLIELRDHVNSGLQTHAEETLKRSSREDSGDLSGYGQHMADAGTDNFDRDFALSLVSNEQEALFEIEEAINRIRKGSYGICELTGKPISKERLLAVPFARYSVESQSEIEKTKRRSSQRGGVFGDAAGDEGAKFLDDDSE